MKYKRLQAFVSMVAIILVLALVLLLRNRSGPVECITVGTSQGGALGLASDVVKAYQLAEQIGLNVEFKYFSPAEAEMALKNRAVDVAYFAPISAVRANIGGDNIKLFGPALYNHYVVLVPPASDVGSLDDLKGKRLGTLARYTGGFSDFAIIWAMKGGDVDKDFEIVEGTAPALAEFLKGGAVDAIVLFEPQATKLVTEGHAKRVTTLLQLWKELFGEESLVMLCFAAHEDWLAVHQDEAKKLLSAYKEAFKMITTRPEVFTAERVRAILGIETEEGRKAVMTNLPPVYPMDWNQDIVKGIEERLQTALRLKLLEKLPEDSVLVILQ